MASLLGVQECRKISLQMVYEAKNAKMKTNENPLHYA